MMESVVEKIFLKLTPAETFRCFLKILGKVPAGLQNTWLQLRLNSSLDESLGGSHLVIQRLPTATLFQIIY